MTAIARFKRRGNRRPAVERLGYRRAFFRGSALLGSFLCTAQPASAQLSGRISLESQYRDRGYEIADDKPVATASISYDHSSGVYANGVAIGGIRDSKAVLTGYELSMGYARRLGRSVSADIGVSRTGYARRAGGPADMRYTEIYAGLTAHNVTARAYYSPDYYGPRRHTLYTELEANIRPLPKWNANLHLGALTYLNHVPRYTARTRLDWRATLSRNLGAVEVFAGVSGRGPGGDYYTRSKGRAVVTFGAAFAF